MTVIARKFLSLRLDEETRNIEIRISTPEPAEHGSWRCLHEIDWPDQPLSHHGYGVDSMQALVLSLEMMGVELYASHAHKQGRLNGGQGGYGIPVTSNCRDLLIGDDATSL